VIRWNINDGGRAEAGYRGKTGDCVVRAITIATGIPYKEVYNALAIEQATVRGRKTCRRGVARPVYDRFLKDLGWTWVPCMTIGSGCRVHLREDELPNGTIICRLSKHLVAVIDGILQDTYDCSRMGTRCVYGYYEKREGYQ
jgi:hypothetical protein